MNRTFPSLLLAALITASTPLLANDAAALRAEMSALQREQQTLAAQLTTRQQQLEQLKGRPSPELDELREAEAAVAQARADLAADASAENEARLKNAEFKHTLAERKFSKANAEVSEVSDAIAALQARQAAARRSEAELTQRIASAERNTERQQQAAAAAQAREQARLAQERELEQTRREAEAAQREVERLRSLLAEQESKPAPAAPAPAPKPAAPAPTVAATAEPKPSVPASASPAALTVTEPATPPAAAADGAARRLATQQEVLGALRAMEQRVAAAGRQRNKRIVNEIVYAKRMQNGKEVDSQRITLLALGEEQYRGAEKLAAGDYTLVLGFNEWPLTVAGSDAASPTVVLLNRSGAKPEVMVYNERLERGN